MYALISRRTTVLVDMIRGHPESTNLPQITMQVLSRIDPQEGLKACYTLPGSNYRFVFYVANGLIFLCVTLTTFKVRLASSFLADLIEDFERNYPRPEEKKYAYSLREYQSAMEAISEHYSRPEQSDKLSKIGADIDEIKGTMRDNIEKCLQRGEKIEHIMKKADDLKETSYSFKRNSTKLKRVMCFQNLKCTIVLIVVILVVIVAILMAACNPNFSKCS